MPKVLPLRRKEDKIQFGRMIFWPPVVLFVIMSGMEYSTKVGLSIFFGALFVGEVYLFVQALHAFKISVEPDAQTVATKSETVA